MKTSLQAPRGVRGRLVRRCSTTRSPISTVKLRAACRLVITSKKEKGQPQYELTTWNWRQEGNLPPDTFAFTPPRGAMRTQFVTVRDEVRRRQQARR